MNSWLFTHRNQSVYVVRPKEGYALTIHGPGSEREHYDFSDEQALQKHQMSLAERYAAAGWILYGIDNQRRVGERRASRRDTPDRRAAG